MLISLGLLYFGNSVDLFLQVSEPSSDEVLWSPRYFQRLWCSYEIATYLTASNEHKPLIVMPAHAGAILFVEYLGWAGISAAFWLSLFAIGTNIWGVMDLLPFAFGRVVIGGSLVAGVAVCVAVPLLAWEISLARHVQHVQQQLLTFNMQETLCYCCSNQHRHPDSGEEIPCDRKLVYQKLRESCLANSGELQEFLFTSNVVGHSEYLKVKLKTCVYLLFLEKGVAWTTRRCGGRVFVEVQYSRPATLVKFNFEEHVQLHPSSLLDCEDKFYHALPLKCASQSRMCFSEPLKDTRP